MKWKVIAPPNTACSVHPTGGSLRVFKQFAWLEVGSGKMALSRPTHQRETQAVGQSFKYSRKETGLSLGNLYSCRT